MANKTVQQFVKSRLLILVFMACIFVGFSQTVEGLDYKQCEHLLNPNRIHPTKDVIYLPTPMDVVFQMLKLSNVGHEDIVYDLGAGDGRVVIAAIKDFGAKKGVGIEYDPEVAELAKCYALIAGVEKKVKIIRGDIFKEDFKEATVVTLVMSEDVNVRLMPILLNMKPGTRVVSYLFSMREWEADKIVAIDSRKIFLWIIPASVDGTLLIYDKNGRQRFTAVLNQSFQKISGHIYDKGKKMSLKEPYLKGDEISFSFHDSKGHKYALKGKIVNREMKGKITLPNHKELEIQGLYK